MAVLPNVTEIVVEMSRRETTSRHKAKVRVFLYFIEQI